MSETATQPTLSLPRLNEKAPAFTAPTTHGERSLSDYAGKWLVLFSHPADFTPVCTTEFLGFSKAYAEFDKIGCELVGLSVDSIYSHIAWERNIRDNFGIEVPFPIIADLSMKVAHAYGMIQPGASDTAAVRAVFVIDPEGVLRAMIYYPLTNGRSVAEILRLVKALQTTAEHSVATPEGWQPGEDVIVPPPTDARDAHARFDAEGYQCVDWYFCKKQLRDRSTTGDDVADPTKQHFDR